MKMVLEQLDGRHKGFRHWTHRVEFQRGWTAGDRESAFAKFLQVRENLWANFGPGCDRDELMYVRRAVPGADPEWGWWTNASDNPYIYFKQDRILTWFTLST